MIIVIIIDYANNNVGFMYRRIISEIDADKLN